MVNLLAFLANLQPQSDHGPQGGGGGTLILFDTCVGSGHFWRVKIFELHYFFGGGGGGSKILIFWVYEDFVDIFGAHDKIGLVLGVFSMYFRVFS